MTDQEPTKAELAQRVDQLETVVEKMLPSRRQALKGLAVAGTGAAFGSAATGSGAGQQYGSATGSIGSDSQPLSEVVAQTVTANVGHISNIRYVPDETALSNVISNVTSGDTLVLGDSDFTTSRTFSARLKIIGSGSFTNGTRIQADWTFDDTATIRDIEFLDAGSTITLNGNNSSLMGIDGGSSSDIQVNADNVLISHVSDCSVTFASGTGGGLVDTATGTSVADNGTNSTGDVV